jgi:hypothetical protein
MGSLQDGFDTADAGGGRFFFGDFELFAVFG